MDAATQTAIKKIRLMADEYFKIFDKLSAVAGLNEQALTNVQKTDRELAYARYTALTMCAEIITACHDNPPKPDNSHIMEWDNFKGLPL